MKIGQLDTKGVTPAVSERRATGTGSAGSSAEPSAKVELSTTVSQLSASGSEGVFDAEKVKRISDAIRDGKFEVNADAIADKLISNARELLSSVGKS
ncbi:flagellar biosynthesis anti-sigma factor FlgM [Aquabacterium sp. OR-4]|uniref:flagellar biosynthesis anti-sigma factor FlgM n=1 Tax=Aquabacterium sp. OR-4 TaxID=2978127 RepID=UPI0021B2A3E3|nr:flagellar biosynthesis anti-sigma factor FlgM [Aquabacterium sp. OR-4]MDT7836197.1 flagellar biosynthesis anti-sigma factor FlgM [Aquabacterium sp. OR-4]